MKSIYRIIYIVLIALMLGCNKSAFLDAKPDQSLVIPKTISELQAVLDNGIVMNGSVEGNRGLNPSIGEIASDNYYMINWLNAPFTPLLKKLYTWADDFYGPTIQYDDWGLPYNSVFYSNLVLDGLKKINPSESQIVEYNNVKGSALFYRAQIFYQLAQVFAPYYHFGATDTNIPGLPLKLTADVNEKIVRSSLKESYNQIVKDLENSAELLPNQPLGGYKTRPSKAAAFGLLSRLYLTIGDYENSLKFSQKSLELYSTLLDYNSNYLLPNGYFSIPRYNPEVLFQCTMTTSGAIMLYGIPGFYKIDSNLFKSYNEKDLRRKIFFRNDQTFKGSYDGSSLNFGGIATDEIYLIRSESYARMGKIKEAMEDLNKLLKARWDINEPFTETVANSRDEALQYILLERRKELLFRGLRWSDLRRLNYEGANITIKRILDGKEYSLLPNDNHYTFLIPPDVIGFNPDMPQNLR